MMRAGLAPGSLALTLTAAIASAGCGSSTGSSAVIVSAASSLQSAFTDYASHAGFDAKQSFAGSEDLAAQIRQGVTPDVFASANTSLPGALHHQGLVGPPRTFAINRLVVAVPAGSPIRSLDDLAKQGTTIAIGAEGVPAGDYAREALAKLPTGERRAILGNVASEEPDVAGIVGKLTAGAVNAGFLYVTDVEAAGGELRALRIPPSITPDVAYGVAIVAGAPHPAEARRFVSGLFSGRGRADLRAAGFGLPPR